MASSSLDTEAGAGAQHKAAAGDGSGYTTAATAHAVDTGSSSCKRQ